METGFPNGLSDNLPNEKIRKNITPWGDGNLQWYLLILSLAASSIRENITPWGDGN